MNDCSTLGPERVLIAPSEEGMKAQLALDKLQRVSWIESLVAPGGWEVMSTFTFRWESSLESTRRCFTRWIARDLPRISYFYGIEQNPSRDGYHVHSLWADCRSVFRKAVWQDRHDRWGRARIEPVRSKQDSSEYASKYLCKPNAWYDIKLQWHRLQKLHDVKFKLREDL